MEILVTGGTGTLGSLLVPRLLDDGHRVRILSRRPRPANADPAIGWHRGDLMDDEGPPDGAVRGADAIVHCASRVTGSVDVEGTGRLLALAAKAGVRHFVYPSIVGIDDVPLGYYRRKRAAETLIEDAGVPWTIARCTQFHTFIERIISAAAVLPVMPLPTDFRFQSVAAAEFADSLVDAVVAGPAGRAPDFAGPEVLTLGRMANVWLDAIGKRRRLVRLPVPGRVAVGFREGRVTAPDRRLGRTTWEEWLERR